MLHAALLGETVRQALEEAVPTPPRLYMDAFHPQRDDLFCIGLIQPDSGQFGSVDDQAQLVARFLQAKRLNAGRAAFDALKSGEAPSLNGGARYLSTLRHALEVEHYSYRRRLRKLSAKLGCPPFISERTRVLRGGNSVG